MLKFHPIENKTSFETSSILEYHTDNQI